MKNRRLSRVASLLLPLFVLAACNLQADTFTVTRTNNTGPGSLPVVISQANAATGNQTIEFAVSGTITLVAPLTTITNSLTINGRVDSPVIVSGGGITPIFTFAAGTTNFLNQLTIANGNTTGSGAAVNNAGTLFVSSCAFTNCQAPNGSGGAISNGGTMTVASSTFSGNQAATGGAVYSSGAMTIADSQLLYNMAGNGGAICSIGSMVIERLTISSNRASLGFGGGIYNSGDLTASATTLSANQANGQSGGSPGRSGGGGGAGLGGGLYTSSGGVSLTNCTFYQNMSNGGVGGSTAGVYDGNGGNGGGNNAGTGATGFSPTAVAEIGGFGGGGGGGNYDYTPAYAHTAGANGGFGGGGGGAGWVTNSAVGLGGFGGGNGGGADYPYGGGGGGGAGLGGSVFAESGDVVAVNCTIAANSAAGGSGGAFAASPPPGSGKGIGAGIFNHNATVSLVNTIVAGNTASDSSPDLYGAFVSTGFNLIGNNQGATGLSINDYQNVAAYLGPLQDNGGPTFTCALLQGSLAIGGGTSAVAPATDERGVPRPPGHCDIGAFQLVTLITPTITWPNPADIVYGTALGSAELNATVQAAGTLTYTPAAGTVLNAGSNQVLQVVFTPADPSQYTAATNSVTINVLKADQTITFNVIPNHQLGDPPILLTPSASSGLPVTLGLLSGPATLTGNLLSFGSTNGWVTVAATQPGNTNNNAAPEVDQKFYLGTFPLPVITAQPASQSVYPGDRVSFTVAATNGPLNYQWQFFGADIAGGTTANLVLARVQASQAGPYRVVVSNPGGSVTSTVADLTVIVSAGTPAIMAQPQGQTIRVGETATLSVVATGDAPLSYRWYQGASGDTNGIIAGATNATFAASGLTTNTTFWVSVHNALGTVDSAAASVLVFPAKAARLKLTMLNGMAALVIDGPPGTQYRLDYTTNLSAPSWSTVIDLVLPSSPYTFVDATSPNAPVRFYRAMAQ